MLDVTRAAPQRHGPLTVFPLTASPAPTLPLVALRDALAEGTVAIREVGTGSVPELLAINSGGIEVLVLDGEQLIGARQNRTTSRSLILQPKSETRIPVSCMEQGRWHFNRDDFAAGAQNSPSSVRRKSREVEAMKAAMAEPAPVSALAEAQGGVWRSIAEKSARLDAPSSTGALDHVYEARAKDIEGWMRDFPWRSDQVGLLAFLDDRPLGLDVIGCTTLYRGIHDRLVRGYVLDALSAPETASRPASPEQAQRYLGQVNSARRVAAPTVGVGEYAVLSGAVVGGELSWGPRLVHLSAFPALERDDRRPRSSAPDDPISPPSRRRMR